MVKIPQYLSLPPRFVFFDLDDLMVGMSPMCLALLFNFNMIAMIIISVGLMVIYMKNKSKASRGFLYHIYYMLGGKFIGFESVHTRRYRE